MVLPATAHAAFHKAAHYFGVEAVLVPVGADFRADAAAMAAAIDDRTVLVVASAPSYAHGVVDPVTEIAAARPRGRGPLPRRRLHRRLGAAVRRPAGPAGDAVDVRGRGRDVDLGRHAQVRLRPQGHLAAAAPRRRAAQAAVLRLGRVAGLHDAQPDDAVHPLRRADRRRLGGGDRDRRRGLPPAGRAGLRGRRPDRRRRRGRPRAARRRAPGVDARRAGHRRHAATPSRSPTRWSRAGGTSSRSCRTTGSRPACTSR